MSEKYCNFIRINLSLQSDCRVILSNLFVRFHIILLNYFSCDDFFFNYYRIIADISIVREIGDRRAL